VHRRGLSSPVALQRLQGASVMESEGRKQGSDATQRQDGARPSAGPVCTRCGSDDVALFLHPKTGRPVAAHGIALLSCVKCGETFGVPPEEALLLPQREPAGTEITEDRRCPTCSYNLKTLKIGGRCPECGSPIRSGRTVVFGEHRRAHSSWDWASIFLVGSYIALGLLCAMFPSWRRPEPVLVLGAFTVGGYGLKGICTRMIALSPGHRDPTFQGWAAIICGSAYVLAGIGLLVLAVGLWFKLF